MMNILKKHCAAVIISVVVCAAALLAGVHLSVGRQTNRIENLFETGVYYDRYPHPSISSQLDERKNAALGIITIASDYDELSSLTGELRQAREQLLNTADDAIYDKYTANNALQKAYEALVSAMEDISLDNNSAEAMKSYIATMNGAQNLIASSGYNNAVSEFERDVLRSFPISILKYAAFVDTPEYFGAEG